jgi:hypothetical protein
MKNRLIWEIFIILILCGTGWYLFGTMRNVETSSSTAKLIESSNNQIFLDGVGIDIMGNNIYSNTVEEIGKTKKTVIAFLLQYESLNDDLKFWNEVGDRLTNANTRLVAYCENEQCVEVIKKNPLKAHFQVLEYGEITDMQAIISADANGEFWLINSQNDRIKLNWRDGILTPNEIARSINQWDGI